MPDKFLNDIDQVANDENRSRSELIREALRQYMKSNNMNFNVNDLTALK
jgi:metal-responsive CopG/Arc/MetJ family transcriptional regulator